MYAKPKVARFGTLRELTKVGITGATDGIVIAGTADGSGCQLTGQAGQPSNTQYPDIYCPRS